MADYTGIKIFSITLNGATHPTTGTVASIDELFVRDNGLTTETLTYNYGGATNEEIDQTLTIGGTDYTDVTDVTHGTITVGGVEVSGTFLSVIDPNTSNEVDFFIPDATDGVDAELLDAGGTITATTADVTTNSTDYADMYSTPTNSIVGSASAETIDTSYTGDKTGDTVDNTGGNTSDVIYARGGDDTIDAGAGNDTVYGEDGDDTFIVKDGFGADFYVGGEGGETTGDTLDASSMTNAVTINMGQTVQSSFTALVLDATIDEDPNNSIVSSFGNYVAHFGQASITDTGEDTGVAGSTADALEPSSGQSDIGGTSITIDGVVYTTFGRTEDSAVLFNSFNSSLNGYLVAAYPDGSSTPVALFFPKAGAANEAILASMDNDTKILGIGEFGSDVTVPYADLIAGSTTTGGTMTSGGETLHFTEMEKIETGSGDDVINGDNSGLVIESNVGDDTITTGDGADTINGGNGDDSITSGGGNDYILGGGGNNIIDAGAGNDSVYTGAGDDSIDGGDGDDVILARAGNDTVIGGEGDNLIDGGDGDNSITSGSGADTITAGVNNDTITSGAGNDSIDAGDGINVIDGGEGNNSITTGTGADTITAGSGNDTVNSGSGDDSIDAGDGINVIDGGEGNNSITTGTGADTITAGSGNDTVNSGSGDDSIDAGDGINVIDGGEGNNIITTGTGADTITAGSGNDTVNSGSGDDSIDAGDGINVIDGGEGNNSITTGTGADTITAGSGNDTVNSGSGDDSIDAGDGANVIDGGEGNNIITTGTGADTITAGSGNDTVNSGSGDDSIDAGDGINVIDGGEGNNIITTGTGADKITAGSGNDTVNSGSGDDSIDAGDGVNVIDGGDGNDTITTGSGADTISGGSGADLITSGSGNDTVDGGDGNDTIDGGDGDDLLDGGTGDDKFILNGGNDTVTGGEGSDLFEWNGSGNLTITDFAPGTSGEEGEDEDIVDLSKYYADLTDLRADFADDGILNQSTGDYSGVTKIEGSLTFANDDGSLSADDLTAANTRVPCFADTVMVMTDTGERMVGDLKQGDLVLTMDSGYAPVRWIGHRSLDAAHFAQHPAHRPIRIRQGALGPNLPSRDLIVSPQHRVLVRSDLAQQITGQPEALVAAKHLLPLPGVTVAGDMDAVTYVHIMFDQHEVVFSDGLATESFYTGDQAMAGLAPEARAEIMAIFPELQSADFSKTPSARPFLDGEQGLMLAKAHKTEKRALLA